MHYIVVSKIRQYQEARRFVSSEVFQLIRIFSQIGKFGIMRLTYGK